MTQDVIVIGGGASGMMAAIIAARNGASVVLLEKNKSLGQKLGITGGGRCNITNAEEDTKVLLSNYGSAAKYLHSAFAQFGVDDTIDFFSKIGLPIVVQGRKRAFPESENAKDVVDVMVKEMKRLSVDVRLGSTVDAIIAKEDKISHIVVGGKELQAKNYILATGGRSRPETGSTGDGFEWLQYLGHTVREPTPNVTPLAVKEPWIEKLSGTIAKSAGISFYSDDKKSFKLQGDFLFTHFGLSGPLILNSAYRVAELLEAGEVTAKIDFYPTLNAKELDSKVIGIFESHPSKLLKNVLSSIAGSGPDKALLELLDDAVLDKKVSEISKQNRQIITSLLKSLPLTIEKLMGFEKAVVADGGLSLKDIDTRTMRSNIINNLYITGDLLDINRPSGGFSLQLCWTSGFIAGIRSSK